MSCNTTTPRPLDKAFCPLPSATGCNEQQPGSTGFVLVATLVLLAVLTLLTVTLFTISINDTVEARNHTNTQRSKLAANSGFEAAKALLLQLTRSDNYFVSASTDKDPDPSHTSPYHFISIPQKSGMLLHMPLWAGGIIQLTPPGTAPQWLRSESLAPADAVLVGLSERSVTAAAGRIALQPAYTSWIEGTIDPEKDSGKIRYTFWIEDLEGLPQIDVMGSAQISTAQTLRLGYSRFDPRLPNFTSTGRFQSGTEYGTRFAVGLANPNQEGPGQPLVDAIAPGLSPKEINLAAGSLGGQLAAPARAMAKSGRVLTSAGAGSFDDRLTGVTALGLHPYLRVPYVPTGLGYPAQNQPKANLNTLLSEGPMALFEHLRSNLPAAWQQRGGAFPDDYLAALAANIVDYADTDSLPSSFTTGSNNDDFPIRGVENYPVVNECYYRFQWISSVPDNPNNPTNITIQIGVTPFVEFWNQTNRRFSPADLSLVYAENGEVLATNFHAEFGANLTRIDLASLDHVISHKPTGGSLRLTRKVALPENGCIVVAYPTVIYEFKKIPLQPGEQQPEEFILVGKNGDYDIGTYKILWQNRIIDWAPAGGYRSPAAFRWAGAGSAPPARQRFRGGDGGHHYLRAKASGKLNPSARILNPGDPRMSYFFREHVQEENDYAADATLGSRNAHANAAMERAGSQVNPEFWPDGGYRTAIIPHPGTENTNPTMGNPLAANYSDGSTASIGKTAADGGSIYNARAPFRLSNLGRFYSITELGNIHDPIMYPSNQKQNDPLQWLEITNADHQGRDALAQGGGNTLRIGRPEHPALVSTPAYQLLDLFHVGINGTNLLLPLDATYIPAVLLQPPSGRDAQFASGQPQVDIYGPQLHAESPFEAIRGRLNINTASIESLRMLLEGVLAVDAGYGDDTGRDRRHPVHSLAMEIHQNRPFTSLSQVARVFHENPPLYRNGKTQNPDDASMVDGPRFASSDAVHEEAFARLVNLGQLSSRHFRIHVAGDYLPTEKSSQEATEKRVYEVFLRPIHDLETGILLEVRCDILNMRSQ